MSNSAGEIGVVSNDSPFFGFDFGEKEAPKLGGARSSSAISEAERHRLVKGTKSPTRYEGWLNGQIFQRLRPYKPDPYPIETDIAPDFAKNCTGPGRYTVVGYREWSDEYRIRTETHGIQKQNPPENTGDRVTAILSSRGARKIAESCEFIHLKRGGYTTFLTLTLDAEARERVEVGETTIQREVSRFFDGLKKIYARGFECRIDGVKTKFPGSPDALDYLWVAECPDHIEKETGEITGNNPHVHVLMRYKVPYKFFEAWAERVESLWGQGMAHLEKIKDSSKAGAYMAKAAGYLCKAQGKSDQGIIRGNRYNISASARAPDWVCVGRYELGKMGFLLSEASAHFDEKFGHLKKKRDHQKKKLEKAIGPERHKIGAILEETRRKLKAMPRLSKYQAIFKGKEQFNDFMQWAKTNEPVNDHAWLPEKERADGFLTVSGRSQWLHEFKARRAARIERRKWGSWFNSAAHEFYMIDLLSKFRRGLIQPPEESANDFEVIDGYIVQVA